MEEWEVVELVGLVELLLELLSLLLLLNLLLLMILIELIVFKVSSLLLINSWPYSNFKLFYFSRNNSGIKMKC